MGIVLEFGGMIEEVMGKFWLIGFFDVSIVGEMLDRFRFGRMFMVFTFFFDRF